MNHFRREIAHNAARETVARLLDRGITLPVEVSASIDALSTHLDRGAPTAPDSDALADAYANGATDKAIDAMLVQQTTHGSRAAAYAEASRRLGVSVLRNLTANGDDLTHQLAALAADRIATLERIAALPNLDVAALLRAGDNEGADLAAHADFTAGDLTDLFTLRRAVTQGAEYAVGGINCGMWRDPRLVTQAEIDGKLRPTSTGLDRFVVGLRAGAGLWFPTPGEAEQQARVIADEERAKALKTEREEFARGRRFSSR